MDSSVQNQSDEHMDKTAHHTIAVVLKEVACSPIPIVDSYLTKLINDLAAFSYNRKQLTEMLKESEAARIYNEERIADIAKKIEASRGYNEEKIKDLVDSIKKSHGYSKQQMTKILEKLNESDHYGVLHYGAIFNNVPFCKCLIEDYNCNVNLVGWDGETPLHIAARLADINTGNQTAQSSILLYLLSRPRVKVNIQDSQGRTSLHHAIMYGCAQNARYLISHKAKLDIPDIQGATPLHYACRFDKTEQMINLFQNHPNLFDYKTHDGKRPLDIAVDYGNLQIVEALFQRSYWKRADNKSLSALVNAAVSPRENDVLLFFKNENLLDGHHTALHLACRQLHGHNMISHLINPQSIMYQDKRDGFSPLMVAVQHRQLECVNQLLAHKNHTQEAFELTSPSSLRTVLHICAEANQDKITEALFDCGHISDFLLNATDMMGNTALHVCAEVGNVYMTKRLLFSSISMISISKTPPYRTMTSLDSSRRVPSKLLPTTTTTTAHEQVLIKKHVDVMLTTKNKSKLTPLHVAIHSGKSHVINEILQVADSLKLIEQCDDQRRNSLHMAAEKGHDDIVELLLEKQADVYACDINDCTPLHEAARCSKHREDNIKRAECIKLLVKVGIANVNALNIRRETPLHIACEYGSSELITCLFNLGADPFATNIDGFNCLEVAIEENNEEVVRFLIEHDHAFDLMRNAQVHRKKTSWLHSFVHHYEADTPMRKLIRKMPKLVLRMLDKCSMTVGTIGTDVHKHVFVYEFLDDQYTIREWAQGNFGVENTKKTSELYTSNEIDLVMNNPLFIMASNGAADLMAHRLSNRLVFEKFHKFGIFLVGGFILFYTIFLALFTTIILRTRHPQAYYNLTNFTEFNDALCYNVSQALMKGLPDIGGEKTSADYALKNFLHIIIWLNVVKNIFVIIEISRVHITKTLSYWIQIVALLFGFIFTYDKSYQIDLTFRCPTQWQYGAFGVLISWVALLQYVQFLPVIGLYVAMLSVILRKFMNFLPVLLILISGFTLSFHMLFQNFDAFKNSGLSYIKTALMIAGEFNFDDYMYSDNTEAYYKLAYLIYIFFAVMMTVLVTNLLIGLAVGEIPPLMKQAADHRNKLFFELVADCEIFRYQLAWCLRRHKINDVMAYSYQDLNKKKWYQPMKRCLLKCIIQNNENDESELTTQEQLEQHTALLQELNNQVYVVVQQTKTKSADDDIDNV